MNRVDKIVLCCPDKTHGGVHMVAGHYNPGGESTEGFNSYFHYYLDPKGKLYLSKKVDDEGNDITRSLKHLSEQTRLPLEPDKQNTVKVGSNTEDDKPTQVMIPLNGGELHFRGYNVWIDYGFKVSFTLHGKIQWKVTI